MARFLFALAVILTAASPFSPFSPADAEHAVPQTLQTLPAILTLPPKAEVLADGLKVAQQWLEASNHKYGTCSWTYGTFMIGLTYFQEVSGDEGLREWAQGFGEHYDFKLCGITDDMYGQLCGSTYAELYKMDGSKNQTYLADTINMYDAKIKDPTSVRLWSWVDALFMTMSTWSRIGDITKDQQYFDHMFATFNTSALTSIADGGYALYSDQQHLFTRNPPKGPDDVYWSRGNGWAMGALVAALEFSPPADPHVKVYERVYREFAAKLKEIQSDDGGWRASLLNFTGYTLSETSGSAFFTFGLAYGINAKLLDPAEYGAVVENGWKYLSSTALHDDGSVGYCQPPGASPQHNFDNSTTNDFCVGMFLMAASQIAQLAQ